LYSIVPDDGSGDFTAARNSTATYLGADGLIKTAAINEPRIEFNPDGSYKGLLVEPQRTNLLLRSEEFDDAVWEKSFVGTGILPTINANFAIAPDGNQTADRAFFDRQSGVDVGDVSVIQNKSFTTGTAGKTYTGTVYIKSATSSNQNVLVYINRGSQNEIAVVNVTQEYTRVQLSLTISTNGRVDFQIGTRGGSFGGDFSVDVILWGAQLEEASTASSYIKTVASTVTRVADVISNDLSALVTGDYSMVLDVEANVGRLKVFESLTGFEVDLTGSGRMVVTVASEITLHFPDGRTLEFLKPSDFIDLEFITKLTSNHVKVVATLNRIINQSEIDGLVSGNLNSPLLDTGSVTNFNSKYLNQDYDFFGKIDTSSGITFFKTWEGNNLTSFPIIDMSNANSLIAAWENNNLTSFPLINTSNVSDFSFAWFGNNLTSFPLINTSIGTNFRRTWFGNNLTSFPLIDTSSATNMRETWRNNNLQTWPVNMFDTCPATNFLQCWENNALDQQGVDNILVSINKARVDGFSGSDGVLGINLGTNATPGAAGQAAADALRGDGWTVTLNGY
jgi:hypothetical protein